MNNTQRSPLDVAVKELAEHVAVLVSLPIEVADKTGFIECRLRGSGREILLTTEDNEITLVFGYGHLHAYKFYDEDLPDAIVQMRKTLLAIIHGDTVSYGVFGEDQPLGGGFCSAQEVGSVVNKALWENRWRRLEVLGWNPERDQTVKRPS